MNKKGFTITELLAVIVILGILTSLASVGVTKYRQSVREKELINLHSTIEAGFDNYRSNLILTGGTVDEEVSLCDEDNNLMFDISYNGNRLKCGSGSDTENIEVATISVKVKGDLLENNTYISDSATAGEEKYIKDGTCMITSSKEEVLDENGEYTGEDELVKKCLGQSPNYTPSREEIMCVVLKTKSETLIDDYSDNDSLCRYWR